MSAPLILQPGMRLYRAVLDATEQRDVLRDVLAAASAAPFFKPTMPGTGKAFSVEMTNLGPLGWVSDRDGGYRYQAHHPITAAPWPPIPTFLLRLWGQISGYPAPPEACLVNLYRGKARMGLHQDRDEAALDAPVLSLSLGDDALFRFGGTARGGPTRSVTLSSGDVVLFGGPARLAFHGIDCIKSGSSTLIPGGGRINLTLRRVAKNATPG